MDRFISPASLVFYCLLLDKVLLCSPGWLCLCPLSGGIMAAGHTSRCVLCLQSKEVAA